jgi:hypothetical protein
MPFIRATGHPPANGQHKQGLRSARRGSVHAAPIETPGDLRYGRKVNTLRGCGPAVSRGNRPVSYRKPIPLRDRDAEPDASQPTIVAALRPQTTSTDNRCTARESVRTAVDHGRTAHGSSHR